MINNGMSIIVMRRNSETKYHQCGNCGHMFNSHTITVDMKAPHDKAVKGVCRFCDCKNISDDELPH